MTNSQNCNIILVPYDFKNVAHAVQDDPKEIIVWYQKEIGLA